MERIQWMFQHVLCLNKATRCISLSKITTHRVAGSLSRGDHIRFHGTWGGSAAVPGLFTWLNEQRELLKELNGFALGVDRALESLVGNTRRRRGPQARIVAASSLSPVTSMQELLRRANVCSAEKEDVSKILRALGGLCVPKFPVPCPLKAILPASSRSPLRKWLHSWDTSVFHGLHYTRQNCNFGFYSPLWDKLFGTLGNTRPRSR